MCLILISLIVDRILLLMRLHLPSHNSMNNCIFFISVLYVILHDDNNHIFYIVWCMGRRLMTQPPISQIKLNAFVRNSHCSCKSKNILFTLLFLADCITLYLIKLLIFISNLSSGKDIAQRLIHVIESTKA